jgi:hypothetical protein
VDTCGFLRGTAEALESDSNENMKEVAPGDVIFSFNNTRIDTIGVARSYCFTATRPSEFGTVGGLGRGRLKHADYGAGPKVGTAQD